jgi:cytochrome c biogenesis protein CcmG, thiol:disulfide interchange protein DsbE
MKPLAALVLSCVLIPFLRAQNSLPNITLHDLEGGAVQTGELANEGKPIIICFWATWCSPCKKELNNYAELYDQWKEETGVKLYAVTVDDQRTVGSVAPYVNGVSWDFDILLDTNKQFQQAMGVSAPPHTFLVDGKGKIVWQHSGYMAGDEEELYHQLISLKP